jgi:hypothetical protein
MGLSGGFCTAVFLNLDWRNTISPVIASGLA